MSLFFSIHASAKEATALSDEYTATVNFSIHASAKEATRRFLFILKGNWFSIHASAKEATKTQQQRRNIYRFQSTPPRRRRRCKGCVGGSASQVSIHASAKEATATYCNTPAIMCISSLNNFFVHHF